MGLGIVRVWVGGIEVGTLPREDYDAIVRATRREKRLYLSQAWNLLTAVVRFVVRATGFMTVTSVLLAMAVVAFMPDAVAESLQKVANASPHVLAHSLSWAVRMLWVLSFFVGFFVIVWTPYSFGATDVFERTINWRIRSILEVPAQGDVSYTFVKPSGE